LYYYAKDTEGIAVFEIEKIIGRDKEIRMFRSSLQRTMETKRGSVFLIEGESGFGKTTFLNYVAELSADLLNSTKIASVDCVSPLGDFSISNLQPLKPIAEALALFSQKNSKMTAKTKFALDVGMSILSALPLLGEVPYLIKTVSRDIKEYSQNKSTEGSKKENNSEHKVLEEYLELFKKLFQSIDCAFVLIIDNAHWLDSFSCTFLLSLNQLLQKYNVFLVLTYRVSELNKNLPMNQLVQGLKSVSTTNTVSMNVFDMDSIQKIQSVAFPSQKPQKKLDEWVLQNSQGVPSAVLEYFRYFTKNSPFTKEGEIIDNFESSFQFPNSVKAATSKLIELLTEEELQILCLAAVEGNKFSILVASHLQQSDPVTAIRSFRSIQRKYGVIRSIGTQILYGVQTTCFEFSQTIYYSFFKNIFEKEENDVVHQSISLFLKQLYDNTDDEFVKASIAPYIAAHSLEYGDEVLATEMLAVVSTVAADTFPSNKLLKPFQESIANSLPESFDAEKIEKFFNLEHSDLDVLFQAGTISEKQDVLQGEIIDLRESFSTLKQDNEAISMKLVSIVKDQKVDYEEIRFQFLELISNEEYDTVSNLYSQHFIEYSQQFTQEEMLFLSALFYRSLAEIGELQKSLDGINEILHSVSYENTDQQFILLKNIQLIILFKNNLLDEVQDVIDELMKSINKVPFELKSISLSNIEYILSEID